MSSSSLVLLKPSVKQSAAAPRKAGAYELWAGREGAEREGGSGLELQLDLPVMAGDAVASERASSVACKQAHLTDPSLREEPPDSKKPPLKSSPYLPAGVGMDCSGHWHDEHSHSMRT